MGIFSSRHRRPSPRHYTVEKPRKRGYFRVRKPSTTTLLPLSSTVTQPVSRQPLYNFNYPLAAIPAYGRVQPVSSPYPPMAYNNYPLMMMRPQQIAPTPYLSPMPVQAVYNNPAFASPGPVVGNAYYPSAAPARLLTDWTGGGKISPGFLGPPL